MPAISTTIGVQAPPGSPGQAIDFEGEVVLNCTITNNSGISIEYTVDGSNWASVANGATATPTVSNPQVFRLRRVSSGAYPAVVGLSWVYGDDEAKFSPGFSAVVSPDGGIIALVEVTPFVTRTTTGQAFTGACELAGYDCTVAAGNITVYDSLSAAGTVVVPTTALTLGRVEFSYRRALTLGCHVVLSGAATVNVLVG